MRVQLRFGLLLSVLVLAYSAFGAPESPKPVEFPVRQAQEAWAVRSLTEERALSAAKAECEAHKDRLLERLMFGYQISAETSRQHGTLQEFSRHPELFPNSQAEHWIG